MAYVTLGANDFFAPKEVFPKAKMAAQKALEIDPNLDEAHVALGGELMWYEGDFSRAEKEFSRAIDINPSNGDAHHWYAWLLMHADRSEGAIKEILLAGDLDPLAPRKNAEVGWMFFYIRDYARAVKELKKSIEMFPEHLGNYFRIARVYLQIGKYQEAIESIVHFANNPNFLTTLAYAYALSGEKDKAQEILGKILKDLSQQWHSHVQIAEIYAAWEDKKQAFSWLKKALAESDYSLCFLKKVPAKVPHSFFKKEVSSWDLMHIVFPASPVRFF